MIIGKIIDRIAIGALCLVIGIPVGVFVLWAIAETIEIRAMLK